MKCHLSYIQVYYPGQLTLTLNKPIRFTYEDRLIETTILRHFKPIEIRDYRAEIDKDEKSDVTFSRNYKIDDNSIIRELNGFTYINGSEQKHMEK